jgi:hypothetical protein
VTGDGASVLKLTDFSETVPSVWYRSTHIRRNLKDRDVATGQITPDYVLLGHNARTQLCLGLCLNCHPFYVC